MCLDAVLEIPEKLEKGGIGYKYFHLRNRGLYGMIYNKSKRRTINKWLFSGDFSTQNYQAINNIITARDGTEYQSGWHIYLKKPSKPTVRAVIIKKVKFKNVIVFGWQGFSYGMRHVEIAVAEQIKILPERKTKNAKRLSIKRRKKITRRN